MTVNQLAVELSIRVQELLRFLHAIGISAQSGEACLSEMEIIDARRAWHSAPAKLRNIARQLAGHGGTMPPAPAIHRQRDALAQDVLRQQKDEMDQQRRQLWQQQEAGA